MVSSQTLPEVCVLQEFSCPLEKHLLTKIIKADSGFFFPPICLLDKHK